MQIQVSTNNNIEGSAALHDQVRAEVSAVLERFTDQITRVEVYLSDVNSQKSGVDKRCVMEARLAGQHAMAVDHEADNLDDAISGCVDKLAKAIGKTVDRRADHKGRTSMSGDEIANPLLKPGTE
jgi:ribosomal subunit interface protein